MTENALLIDSVAYLRIRLSTVNFFGLYRQCANRGCRRARRCRFLAVDAPTTHCHRLFDAETGKTLDYCAQMAELCYYFAETDDTASLLTFQNSEFETERFVIRIAYAAAVPGTAAFRNLADALTARNRSLYQSGTKSQSNTTESKLSNTSSSP